MFPLGSRTVPDLSYQLLTTQRRNHRSSLAIRLLQQKKTLVCEAVTYQRLLHIRLFRCRFLTAGLLLIISYILAIVLCLGVHYEAGRKLK
jgi:hypothetical protein